MPSHLQCRLPSPFQDDHILAGKCGFLAVLEFLVTGPAVSAGISAGHQHEAQQVLTMTDIKQLTF